jgi:regulator of sigma E protease
MGFLHLVIGVGLVLGVMILVHEWGHFVMARVFKVRVDVFSIGFGPRLFGWKRGDTDYRLSALPFGGYVRMAGQDPTEIDSENHQWVSGNSAAKTNAAATGTGTATADRRIPGVPVGAQLRSAGWATDELTSKPRWQRALISFAGPAVNLVFPIFLLGGLYLVSGEPVIPYSLQPVQIAALSTDKDAPKSDLRPGDLVRAINGTAVATWDEAFKVIDSANLEQPLRLDVEEKGASRTITVRAKDITAASYVLGVLPIPPVLDSIQPGDPADQAGLQSGDVVRAIDNQPIHYWGQFVDAVRNSGGKNLTITVERNGQMVQANIIPKLRANEAGEPTYQVGVAVKDDTVYQKVGFSQAMRDGLTHTGYIIERTAGTVGLLFSGKVSIKQLQGPVGISHLAKQAVDRGSAAVIQLMALISVNLGILNLLPIPILDGGNILLLAIEGVMRRDLSMGFKERFVQVGLVFLLVLFAIVMYHDVLRRLAAHS